MKTCKAYKYGAKAPIENGGLVEDQIRLSRIYKNRLIELELERRAEVYAVTERLCPDLASAVSASQEAEEAVATAEDAVRMERKAARTRRAATTESKSALAEARKTLRDARKTERALRKEAFARDEVREALSACDEADNLRRKDARANCGIYWGTYLVVEDAAKKFRKGPPPRFRRWDGSGCVAVQIQGGMTWSDLIGLDDTRARLALNDSRAGRDWSSLFEETGRRRQVRAILSVRVGSDGRAPIWASFPVVMHRPLPAGARIKWIRVHRRKVGTHWKWDAVFVIDYQASAPEGLPRLDAIAGVDVGWRRLDEGLRVASVFDGSRHHQLVLPERVLLRDRKVHDLRSIRDKMLGEVLARLVPWISRQALPRGLAERLVGTKMHQWRSAARLASFVIAWREHRFDGDEEMFSATEEWRKQDKHLLDWQEAQRKSVMAHRHDVYRCFAAELSRSAHYVVIEKLDLRDFARKAPAESDDDVGSSFRRMRALACLSSLTEALKQRFGDRLVEVPPQKTTRACAECGFEDDSWDPATELRHLCPSCGVEADQDERAAINIRDRGIESLGPASAPVVEG